MKRPSFTDTKPDAGRAWAGEKRQSIKPVSTAEKNLRRKGTVEDVCMVFLILHKNQLKEREQKKAGTAGIPASEGITGIGN